MKPIKFKEVNVEYAKNQDTYKTLPAYKNDSPMGEVVTCWKFTFIERIILLFTGRLWVVVLSFNKPILPTFMSVKKKEIITDK